MMKVFLKPKIAPRIANGHPWIFINEIERYEEQGVDGDIVDVFYANKKYCGRGYFNSRSQITVRLLSRVREEIGNAFFLKKMQEAWNYRKKIGYTENCRLVFGESDGLPGLIVDKFNDYFVIQTLSLGIDNWKPAIVLALESIFSPKGIYERNDVPVRELEGLELKKGFIGNPFDNKITLVENGIKFKADIANGQKTGYFLDQHDNRNQIMHIVKGAKTLGAFCYLGSFEIHAAHYGAASVLGLDISEKAVEMANENSLLNGYEKICKFEVANAFDKIKQWSKENVKYDVVMIDPPAFTKSRANIDNAVTGYKEINLRAMQLVENGGFLVTSSCSNFITPSLFLEIIDNAARDAKKKLRQVYWGGQAADHPVIYDIESTEYLKFLIVEVSNK